MTSRNMTVNEHGNQRNENQGSSDNMRYILEIFSCNATTENEFSIFTIFFFNRFLEFFSWIHHWVSDEFHQTFPASIYLLKVNYKNIRKRCEIFSKFTTKALERCSRSHPFLVFLLLTWNRYMFSGLCKECRNYVLLKTEQSTSFAEFSFHFLFIMFTAIVSGYF